MCYVIRYAKAPQLRSLGAPPLRYHVIRRGFNGCVRFFARYSVVGAAEPPVIFFPQKSAIATVAMATRRVRSCSGSARGNAVAMATMIGHAGATSCAGTNNRAHSRVVGKEGVDIMSHTRIAEDSDANATKRKQNATNKIPQCCAVQVKRM